ncbi:Cation/calcium exchanger like [Actinidia chinensis var. chinensis]|uniref:Cation/calcium exchanger like n=1 Tax=Actinidia chinensis var. chinensis TaxID=1590841 RepID=A0A2R6QVL7_ACTCC|nr:Cation/calcium exchanger like [Actinidia chinensis var. chinensis]
MDSPTLQPSTPNKLSLFLNTSFLLLLSLFLSTTLLSPPQKHPTTTTINVPHPHRTDTDTGACTGLNDYTDSESKCSYLKSHDSCSPKGYINYLQIFYCTCGKSPALGYFSLILWLVLLFYILGNTASDYFCPSLESLSKILNLSPTIAGTTLLPLGNGVTDVFSSIISFTRSGDGDVGFNSVLGGAFFISSVVVGIISILVTNLGISVDRSSFVRDVLFFLFTLSCLSFIVLVGRISLWGAICFVSIYFVYICAVCVMHFLYREKEMVVDISSVSPNSRSGIGDMGIPLLASVDEEKPISLNPGGSQILDQKERTTTFLNLDPSIGVYLHWFLYLMDLPLDLPRRITIPLVIDEKWSKPYAVISVSLAPILLATLWNTQRENLTYKAILITYLTSGLFGFAFGNLACVATKWSTPPKKYLFPWVAGGFLMSITWTYIIAEELVSLLVSFGTILGISPAILGLTVLAWGNSIGDLIANVAVALRGGPGGAQIAISGCYAGPLFNTLMGLGVSLVFASWSEYPAPYVVPSDPYLGEILGFLIAGLLWALVVLPKKDMRLDRSLGGGLLVIYSCFLFLRFARALGIVSLEGFYGFRIW